MFTVLGTTHHLDLHNCAVSEESTILTGMTGCVDFDTSMNIRYMEAFVKLTLIAKNVDFLTL
jgi:hypothetical protein